MTLIPIPSHRTSAAFPTEWTAQIGASGTRRASERRARPGAAPAHEEEEERREDHRHQQRPGAPQTVREKDEHLAVASISLAAPHLRLGLGPAICGERGSELIALLERAVRPTTDESSAAHLRVNAFALRCLPLRHSGAPSPPQLQRECPNEPSIPNSTQDERSPSSEVRDEAQLSGDVDGTRSRDGTVLARSTAASLVPYSGGTTNILPLRTGGTGGLPARPF